MTAVGKVIGVDLGLKRVGTSISDDLGAYAHPLVTIPYTNQAKVVEELAKLGRANNASCFVIGFPKNMDGSLGESARRSMRFAGKLKNKTGLPVVLWDERLTTSQAEREMIGLGLSRKARRLTIDQAASVLILENYLQVLANTKQGEG